MTQFTVYQNKNPQSKKHIPLLLDIQSNLLEELNTTVIVPLCKLDQSKNKVLTQLTPVFNIDGAQYLMLAPQLAGIARKQLGKAIGNIASSRAEIIGAIDFLLSGV